MSGLLHNMALNEQQCLEALQGVGQETHPVEKDGLWCNATWDSVLCWPAIPADTSHTFPCPPLKGLDPTKLISKHCHASGRWTGRPETDFSKPSGWTDYISCMLLDYEAVEKAGETARNLRTVEMVYLALSMIALIAAIFVLLFFRPFRTVRNKIRVHLLLAILLGVVVRFILYIDIYVLSQRNPPGGAINTTNYVCEAFYVLLEYAKMAPFVWIFIDSLYLHDVMDKREFKETRFYKCCIPIIGWVSPVVIVLVWFLMMMTNRGIKRCLGLYYLNPEIYILDSERLGLMIVTFGFLINMVRVIWCVRARSADWPGLSQLKISIITALLITLIMVVSAILQTIPVTPRKDNINFFSGFVYIASILFVLQGFLIGIICCLGNKEVYSAICGRRSGNLRQENVPAFDGSKDQAKAPSAHAEPTQPLLPPSYESTVILEDGDKKLAIESHKVANV